MYKLIVHPVEGPGAESARMIAELPDRSVETISKYIKRESIAYELSTYGLSIGGEVYMLLENSSNPAVTSSEAYRLFEQYVEDTWEDNAQELFSEVLSRELNAVVHVNTNPPGIYAKLRAGIDENVELEWVQPLVEMVNSMPERYSNFSYLVVDGKTLKMVRDYGEVDGIWSSSNFFDITEAVALGKFLEGLEKALKEFRQEMIDHDFEEFLEDNELVAFYS